jgi:hypothetical protein
MNKIIGGYDINCIHLFIAMLTTTTMSPIKSKMKTIVKQQLAGLN